MSEHSPQHDFLKNTATPALFDHQQSPPLLDMATENFGSAGPTKMVDHSQNSMHSNDFNEFDNFRGGATMQDPFGSVAFGGAPPSSGAKQPNMTAADLLGDFIEKERGDPPAPPQFNVHAEINNTFNGKGHDFDDDDDNLFKDNDVNGAPITTTTTSATTEKVEPEEFEKEIQKLDDLYLNPYTASKLEANEKFISTDDLIGLSDNESKEKEAPHFEDCYKEDEIETEVKPPAPVARARAEPPPPPVRAPVVEPQPEKVTEQPKKVVEAPKKKESPQPVELLEAEKLFKRIGLDSWFKPETLHPKVESLIYWRDIKKSGVVFGSGLVLLLALSYCSLISVFAYVSLIALAGTIAFRIYKNILQAIQKTAEGHPFKDLLEFDITLSQERVQQVTTTVVSHINAALTELRRLFLVEDLVDSIKFGVLLYCLTYVGAIFNGMTLIILGFIGLFSLPKVYETNKTVIDAQIEVVRGKITEVTDKIKAAVPIGKKAETDKDK